MREVLLKSKLEGSLHSLNRAFAALKPAKRAYSGPQNDSSSSATSLATLVNSRGPRGPEDVNGQPRENGILASSRPRFGKPSVNLGISLHYEKVGIISRVYSL